MNVLSVLCLLLLVPYVVIALAFTPRGKGRMLFRMIYSAVVLGGIGALCFVLFENTVSQYSYLGAYAEQLRTVYACFMLLIPASLALVLINAVLKKPKSLPLFWIGAGISLAGTAGIVLYSYFTQNEYTTSFSFILSFAIVYLPVLLGFLAGGILPYEGRAARACHWTIQVLILLSILWFLISAVAENWSFFLDFGISDTLRFVPVAFVGLAIPGIPLILLLRESDLNAGVKRKKGIKKEKSLSKRQK